MGRSAAVTGGIGDIVYAIPVMRKLNITTLYVKENLYGGNLGSMYTVCERLLATQGIECLPIEGGTPFGVFPSGLVIDYDLDAWRCRPGRDRVHIIKNMCLHYRVSVGEWNKPFLKGFEPYLKRTEEAKAKYLIFLTPRWRENSNINWCQVMDEHGLTYGETFFIGHPADHHSFITTYRNIRLFETVDLLAMAHLIAACTRLFCNQGVALTIAQGLGKSYYLEVKPGKSNTLMYGSNEHILKQ